MSAPGLRQFQMAMGRRLRDPRGAPRPPGVPARRLAVYEDLLFNNLCGFLDACFPVCREVLGETRWRRLNRAFFRDWRSPTPWFREIPCEFARWLAAGGVRQPLPRWFAELARYEWAELAVDVMETAMPAHDPAGDLLRGRPLLAPARLLLAFAWPVHRIGPDFRPRRPEETHLLVYRDAGDEVRFFHLNPVTAKLLERLAGADLTGESACRQIAAELDASDPDAIVRFGGDLLDDLRRQGVILGVMR